MREVRRLVELRRSFDKQRSRDMWRATAHRSACVYCPQATLSIASYNIWGVRRSWDLRRERIVQVLRSHPADVLALQEVQIDRSNEGGGRTQAAILTGSLGYTHVYYARAHKAAKEEGGEEGLAVLSRFPIISSRSVNMTRPSRSTDLNHRVFLHVVLDAPAPHGGSTGAGGALHILAAHWTYDTSGQCAAARQMLAYANALPSGEPVVMVGDFNIYLSFEFPMDYITRTIPPSFRDSLLNPCHPAHDHPKDGHKGSAGAPPQVASDNDGGRPAFWDAFSRAHPLEEGWTFTNFELSEDADLRQQATRPDRILVRGPPRWAVRDAFVYGDEADAKISDKVYASDHRALYISLVANAPATPPDQQQHWLRSQRAADFVTHSAGVHSTLIIEPASPTAQDFYVQQATRGGPPLLLKEVKAGTEMKLHLQAAHYPSRIEVRTGDCAGAGASYGPLHHATVLVTFDEPLNFPHFQRQQSLGVLKDGVFLWEAPLVPLEKQDVLLFVALRVSKPSKKGEKACVSRFTVA
jgi:endonuclease/exonuclease/phosphatase family metal-dependent hydrolase